MTRPMSKIGDEALVNCVRCSEKFLESFCVKIGGAYVCLDCKAVGDVVDGEQVPIEQRFDAQTQVIINALGILHYALTFSVPQDNGKLDTDKVYRTLADRRLSYLLMTFSELSKAVMP